MNQDHESIFVGNIGPDATQQALRDFFEENDVHVSGVDIKTGFAFVYIDKLQYDIDEMIHKMKGKPFGPQNRIITVEKSIRGMTAKLREQKRKESVEPTDFLFIAGLGAKADERDLRDLFSEFGALKFVEVRKNFCFVGYYSVNDATRAIEALDGKDIGEGRVLSLEYGQKKVLKVSEHSNRDDDSGRNDDRGRPRGRSADGRSSSYRDERDRDRDRDRGRDRESDKGSYPPANETSSYLFRGNSGLGGGLGASVPASTAAAIRDREIAEAFIRMREWEAYYFSLIAERDAMEKSHRPTSSSEYSPRDRDRDRDRDTRENRDSRERGRDRDRDGDRDGRRDRRPESLGTRATATTASTTGSRMTGAGRSKSRSRSRSRDRNAGRSLAVNRGRFDRVEDRPKPTRHPRSFSKSPSPARNSDNERDYRRGSNGRGEDEDDGADMFVNSIHQRSRSESV